MAQVHSDDRDRSCFEPECQPLTKKTVHAKTAETDNGGTSGWGSYVKPAVQVCGIIVGAKLAITLTPITLTALGFTATGVAPGSIASALNSVLGDPAVISVLKSTGAAGLGYAGQTLVAAAGGIGGLYGMQTMYRYAGPIGSALKGFGTGSINGMRAMYGYAGPTVAWAVSGFGNGSINGMRALYGYTGPTVLAAMGSVYGYGMRTSPGHLQSN